jgi:hypothetical protein
VSRQTKKIKGGIDLFTHDIQCIVEYSWLKDKIQIMNTLAHGQVHGQKKRRVMQDILIIVGLIIVWFVIRRYLFPKLGIKG